MSSVNKDNPHRDRLLAEYPQRPLWIPPPGFPIGRAIADDKVLANVTGLTRHVAWVDGDGVSHIETIEPDPALRGLYRGRLG